MKTALIPLSIVLLSLTACKPPHHPTHPNYNVIKPKVKYTPSKENLEKMVKQLQGSPYVWAEEGPDTFDCSGYTYYMYGSMGIDIPRVAREQAKHGTAIDVDALRYGDLIFFDTERHRRGRITHVGMYLGNGWFTHASTTDYEIVYSNLNTSSYYKKRLRVCRRYLPSTLNLDTPVQKPWKVQTTQKKPTPPRLERGHGNFYIQVGSFSGEPKQSLLKHISNLGYEYKRIQFTHQDKKIVKLLIGPYEEKAAALQVLPSVKQQIQKAAFIAEIR